MAGCPYRTSTWQARPVCWSLYCGIQLKALHRKTEGCSCCGLESRESGRRRRLFERLLIYFPSEETSARSFCVSTFKELRGKEEGGRGGRRLRKEEGGRRGVLSGRYGRRYFRGIKGEGGRREGGGRRLRKEEGGRRGVLSGR